MKPTQDDIEAFVPKLTLTSHTGLLLFWSQRMYVFKGDPETLRPQLKKVTVWNLILGWWSIVSVFINPAVTIGNFIEFNNYKKEHDRYLASPDKYIFETQQAAQKGEPKNDQRFKLAVKIFIGLAIFISLVLVVGILDQAPRY